MNSIKQELINDIAKVNFRTWQETRKLDDGKFEPYWVKIKDEKLRESFFRAENSIENLKKYCINGIYTIGLVTGKSREISMDIANVPFELLEESEQKKFVDFAQVLVDCIFCFTPAEEDFSDFDFYEMEQETVQRILNYIHEGWKQLNPLSGKTHSLHVFWADLPDDVLDLYEDQLIDAEYAISSYCSRYPNEMKKLFEEEAAKKHKTVKRQDLNKKSPGRNF